ncbi:hypothetical protein Lal_00029029 [Lupinus albus]|uniref:Putative transcription factor C3H family n=1 Tax=Lupinus albus TaxID=3870 RepID=A0A6A5NQJ6_LUPAL|nr:putative transcription factor C3H family [Lupinus albus]KAF1885140.1 hypothetical protein Lal_00029029 [Lupinus albus]
MRDVCRNFQRGSCQYGERCRYLHQQQNTNNPFGFGSQSQNNNNNNNNPFGFKPFENKWNRSNPQSAVSRQSSNNPQPPNHNCTDPDACKRQIAEDFQQEKPLWILTCYTHSKGAACDIVGDISYEELRASAYEDAKKGITLQSIVEKERNLLKSKMAEFEKLLSQPYTRPLNSSIHTQNHHSIAPNTNPFSTTTQNTAPLSVSSFSQLGASLNMASERPSAPLINSPAQIGFFGNGGTHLMSTPVQPNLFGFGGNSSASNTANLSGKGFSGPQSSPNSNTQQPSAAFNDFSSFTMFQTTSDVQLNKPQVENVSGDTSIWLKEKWNPGEIPEEAPPDAFVR